MKKRIITSLLTLMCVILCVFGLSACGGGGSSVNGTYYLYENGQYNKNNYITLDGNTWTDDDGESGDYTISGDSITIYIEYFGEKEEFASGTAKNGVLTLNIMGADIIYCQEGKAPSDNFSQKYTVTYDANGGKFAGDSTTIEQKDVLENSTLTAPDSPTRSGYSFGGWAINNSGSEMWKFATDKVTKNLTLYAVWQQESAAILSVDGAKLNGTKIFMLVSPDTESVSLSNKVVCSTDSVWKLYYDKLGQTEIPTKIAAGKYGELNDGDNVFYIVVTSSNGSQVNVYELTVHRSYAVAVSYYHKGKNLKTQTVYTGDTFTANYKPDISGYTFNAWKTSANTEYSSSVLWESMNLYADATANNYTVTLDVNGGNKLSETTKTLTYDESFSFSVPTRNGYSFKGWYIGSTQVTDEKGKSIAAWTYTDNKTATAQWQANQYSVTLKQNDDDAGTVMGAGDYYYDSNVTVTATTNPGYNFLGWYDEDGNLVTENRQYTFKMGFAVTYTAKWDYYTVTTNNTTGGSVTSYDNKKVSVGETVKLTATTNVGYTFIGWYNGEIKLTDELSYTFTMPAENVIYTAKWIVKEEMAGFNFTSTSSTCTITGIKDKTVTDIVVPDYVTSISSDAFSGCSSIESATIPAFSIGYIPKTNLKTVVITSGTGIDSSAFSGCTSLTSITIPGSVTIIGDYAFWECISLTSVYITDIAAWCNISFGNYLANPLWHAHNLYLNGELVTDLVIPEGVTSIGEYAFWGCSSLTSVTFGTGSKLKSIGVQAFYNCSSLTSITIPGSVKSIGNYAFMDCSSLTSITIPGSVKSIGSRAFECCYKLVEVYNLSSLNITKGSSDYGYVGYYALVIHTSKDVTSNLFTDENGYIFYEDGDICYLVGYTGNDTELTLPENCNGKNYGINQGAFYECSSLTSITIPRSVKSIGKGAFRWCSSLTSVTFENTEGWWYSSRSTATSGTSISSSDLGDSSTAAEYLKFTYYDYYWKRS